MSRSLSFLLLSLWSGCDLIREEMDPAMISNFKNQHARAILARMLGKMTPAEICAVIEDKEVKRTDIPKWTELVIQENCTILLERLKLYTDSINQKYGDILYTVQKLSVYHKIWTNWDGKEPCPFNEGVPLESFYDSAIMYSQSMNKYAQ